MMFVIYDPATGEVRATSAGTLPPRSGQYVELPEADLGDLTAWRVIDGALVRVSIEPLKQRAVAQVNTRVGEMRAALITTLPGQEMLYLRKEDEARAYVALAEEPATLADFPLIAAEVGITAETPWQLAQLWLAMSALWKSTAAQLEGLRMSTIGAIGAATTAAEIDVAIIAFTTASS
jgi:hypothetical protein